MPYPHGFQLDNLQPSRCCQDVCRVVCTDEVPLCICQLRSATAQRAATNSTVVVRSTAPRDQQAPQREGDEAEPKDTVARSPVSRRHRLYKQLQPSTRSRVNRHRPP